MTFSPALPFARSPEMPYFASCATPLCAGAPRPGGSSFSGLPAFIPALGPASSASPLTMPEPAHAGLSHITPLTRARQPHPVIQPGIFSDRVFRTPTGLRQTGRHRLNLFNPLKQLSHYFCDPPTWPIHELANQRQLSVFNQPLTEQVPEAITLLRQSGLDAKHCKRLCQAAASGAEPTLRLMTHAGQTHPILGAILYDQTAGRLFGLAVEPQQQKKGIGSFLLATALTDVQHVKGRNGTLNFSTDNDRTAARKLYARAGAQAVQAPTTNAFFDDAFSLTPEDLLPGPHAPRSLEMTIALNSRQCRRFIAETFSDKPSQAPD